MYFATAIPHFRHIVIPHFRHIVIPHVRHIVDVRFYVSVEVDVSAIQDDMLQLRCT